MATFFPNDPKGLDERIREQKNREKANAETKSETGDLGEISTRIATLQQREQELYNYWKQLANEGLQDPAMQVLNAYRATCDQITELTKLYREIKG